MSLSRAAVLFCAGFALTVCGDSGYHPVVQTKSSFGGCSTAAGCGGLTVENGKVTHQFGNPAAIGIDGPPESLDPAEFHKKFVQQASDINSAFSGSIPANGPFWWANQDSPFKNAYETYTKWIKTGLAGVPFPSACTVCQLSNSLSSDSKVTSEGGISNSIDISNNPFLNGQFAGFADGAEPGGGVSTSFQSSFGSTSTNGGGLNIAANPFLNGAIAGSTGGCSGSGGCGGAPVQKPAGGCGGAACNFGVQSQTYSGFAQQSQSQQPFPALRPIPDRPPPQFSGSSGFRGDTVSTVGVLTVSCSGKGQICVEKNLCVNGYLNTNGENILQARGGVQCKTATEVCCKVKSKSENPPPYSGNQFSKEKIDSASLQSSISTNVASSSGLTYVPGSGSGVGAGAGSGSTVYGDSSVSQTEDRYSVRPGSSVLKPGIPYLPPLERETPGPTPPPYRPTTTAYRPPYVPPSIPTQKPYVPPPYVAPSTTTRKPYVPPSPTPTPYRPSPTSYRPTPTRPTSPPYLPPKEDERPQSSFGSQQIVPGPKPDTEGTLLLDNLRPGPSREVPIVPSACAAALKCTKIEFCTADGMISNSTVALTKEQQEFRVPLTDCKDVEGGFVGKCCRDPTYTDPWPTNQLGQWVPGAFGDSGAYRGDSRRPPGPPTNGGVSGPKGSGTVNTAIRIPNPNRPPTFPRKPNDPPKNYNGGDRTDPQLPQPPRTPSYPQPQVPRVPQTGSPGNSYTNGQLHLDSFQQGGSCGVRQPGRPSGNKQQFEVDFGEIPWQAMILLQTNRSLLCGGVITAPDAVVTSAHCVDGLEPKNVLIKGGEWKLGVDEEPLPYQIVQVGRIMRHPGYRPGSLQNDLAILMLTEKLRFAPNIAPICLPSYGEAERYLYSGNTKCIVTGWGKQVLQVNIPNSIMHSLDMSLVEPGQCQAQISQNYPHLLENYNRDTCICGQPSNSIANVCRVDIGSALACTNGNGAYYMHGVYSWDSGCTSQNQIASFFKFDMTWYESTMESASSQSQVHETFQVGQQQQQRQQQNQYAAVQGHSPAGTGQTAFQQAIGAHSHGGAQCQCNENGKK